MHHGVRWSALRLVEATPSPTPPAPDPGAPTRPVAADTTEAQEQPAPKRTEERHRGSVMPADDRAAPLLMPYGWRRETCPRCGGWAAYMGREEPVCLNCGWRPMPNAPKAVSPQERGPYEPREPGEKTQERPTPQTGRGGQTVSKWHGQGMLTCADPACGNEWVAVTGRRGVLLDVTANCPECGGKPLRRESWRLVVLSRATGSLVVFAGASVLNVLGLGPPLWIVVAVVGPIFVVLTVRDAMRVSRENANRGENK